MNRQETGYVLMELMVTISIMVLASVAAGGAIFQIFTTIERSNALVTAGNQLNHAGYWISRDAQMAETIVIDNTNPAIFLTLDWFDEDTPCTAVYSFENEGNNVGSLIRAFTIDGGTTEQKLVADYLYFHPDDEDNTTIAGYFYPFFSVNLTIQYKSIQETREYLVKRRIENVN